MGVTVTVSKDLLEMYPEVNYQLFYLSRREEEREYTCVYTPLRYYRELTDLLDLYQIPYQIESSQHPALLHVLIADEKTAGEALKRQLEQWGFRSIEIIAPNDSAHSSVNHKKVALALLDNRTVRLYPFRVRARLLIRLVWVPIIFLLSRLRAGRPAIGYLAKTSRVLYKPYSQRALRESVERILNISLVGT